MPLRLPICNPATPPTVSMPLAAPPPYCKLTISFCAFRSHTEVKPEDDEAAKTRETVGFHCNEVISPSLVESEPGAMGFVGLFRSKMYSCRQRLPSAVTHLSIDSTRQQQVLLDWVEVETADGASVLVVGEDARGVRATVSCILRPTYDSPCAGDDLLRIKDVDFSCLHTSCEHTSSVRRIRGGPSESVEPVVSYSCR